MGLSAKGMGTIQLQHKQGNAAERPGACCSLSGGAVERWSGGRRACRFLTGKPPANKPQEFEGWPSTWPSGREPVGEEDHDLAVGHRPIAHRHRPLLGYLLYRKKNALPDRIIRWENGLRLGQQGTNGLYAKVSS